jgi:hypothetical protein
VWLVPSESNPRGTSRRPTCPASVELTTCRSSAAKLRCVLPFARPWRGRGGRPGQRKSQQRSSRSLPCPRPPRHRPRRRRRRHRARRSQNLHRPLPRLPHQNRPRCTSTTQDDGPERSSAEAHPGGRDADVYQSPPSASRTRGPRRPRAREDSAAAPTGAVPQRGACIGSPRRPDLAQTSLRCCDRGRRPQQSRSRRPRPEAGPHPCLSAPGRDARRPGHPSRASASALQPGRWRFEVSLAGGAGRVADRRAQQRLLTRGGVPGDDDGARRRAPRLAGAGQGSDRASDGERPGEALCQPTRVHRHLDLRVRPPRASRQPWEAISGASARRRGSTRQRTSARPRAPSQCSDRCVAAAG